MALRLNHPGLRELRLAELSALRSKPFSALASLPRSQRLSSPKQYKGIELRLERREGEQGGVRIEVRTCSRHLLVFVACLGDGFEMLPDGRIVEDEPPGPPED